MTTVSKRGQVTIPASIRRQLKLKPGQKLRWQKVAEVLDRAFGPPFISSRALAPVSRS